MRTVAVTFGRFSPPTNGHLKLLEAVANQPADSKQIYTSHSQDKKKNPLSYDVKIQLLQQLVSEQHIGVTVVPTEARTLVQVLGELTGQFDVTIVVVGSDRVPEFQALLDKYNGIPDKTGSIPFSFDSVEVVSAGERDPDAEGVEGMSATKMRQAAKDEDYAAFQQGSPFKSQKLTKQMYIETRKGMGIE